MVVTATNHLYIIFGVFFYFLFHIYHNYGHKDIYILYNLKLLFYLFIARIAFLDHITCLMELYIGISASYELLFSDVLFDCERLLGRLQLQIEIDL